MTVTYDYSSRRGLPQGNGVSLETRFEVLKEVGDGSFGSVVLARTRTAGADVARRGTLVAIKTMKKTFESFKPCLELREVIFLKSLPHHPHLVPALDIFLDPFSKKLHICMEYMDGNLYQLMKARDHKCLDGKSVKSILYQILSGLDHIHAHHFFHRDIKPENILVSTSAPNDSSSAFSRYSALVTPPSTPPAYTVKIADFGLARETHSKLPYTTYVSTRWYRAPEVLLRAGEYSAPVDIWAIGAMAVEIATLKPLFPGGNEVDQVWRVCEIMGSPGNWYNKSGAKVGGGDWREGTRLAQKLGFSFPKMAPHSIDTILQQPQWPAALCHFVTWCLMWDPKNRPTTQQALNHEYFADAIDPLRPKSSTARLLGKKHSDTSFRSASRESGDSPTLSSKPSWFRRSLIGRESLAHQDQPTRPLPVASHTQPEVATLDKTRPPANKRATWTNGTAAPMHILPSIKPVSPLSAAVTAQADSTGLGGEDAADSTDNKSKKIGRQLSVNSNANHYVDVHRQEAERALNGGNGLMSPPNGQKESFFSHLRKRARRLSGRNQANITSHPDDIEATAGCAPWSNRSSLNVDSYYEPNSTFVDLDRTLAAVKYNMENPSVAQGGSLKRHHSVPKHQSLRSSTENLAAPPQGAGPGPISSRTRRALQMTSHPVHRYETPEEEDELLHEALNSANRAARRLDEPNPARHALAQKDHNMKPVVGPTSTPNYLGAGAYPTPSPSAKRDEVIFGQNVNANVHVTPSKPVDIARRQQQQDKEQMLTHWPTPPYEENEWAASAAASIFAAGNAHRY